MEQVNALAFAAQSSGFFVMVLALAMILFALLYRPSAPCNGRNWESKRLTRGMGGYAQNDDYVYFDGSHRDLEEDEL